MGLIQSFKKFFAPPAATEPAVGLAGFSPMFPEFGADFSASDIVAQAIARISDEMSKLNPVHVRMEGSGAVPVWGDVQRVLDDPNPLMNTGDMIAKLVYSLYLNDNAFAVPVWENETLAQIYPVQPSEVDFLQDRSGAYFVTLKFPSGYQATVRYSEIIHIRRNYGASEFMGGGVDGQPDRRALMDALKLNKSLWGSVEKGLAAGMSINGVIRYNTLLDDGKTEEAMRKLTEALKKSESGFLPLDLKGEFIPIKRDPKLVDAETLALLDSKILRFFGVPAKILLGDYDKSDYEAWYQMTLEPLAKSMSRAFTRAIFTRREAGGYGHRIEFMPDDLIFMTMADKHEMVRLLGDSGALTENEKRRVYGLPPLAELDGVRKASLNYVDVKIANQYQTGNPDTEAEPAAQEE